MAFTVMLTPSTQIEPYGTHSSATSGGTAMSIRTASPFGSTLSTFPTPSTCPCTTWPPNRSPAAIARSRFTPSPWLNSPKRVRPRVVTTASIRNQPSPRSTIVMQAPLIAMLSPTSRSG